MSMRQRVGRQEIEQFLIQVGRTRRPGQLYLTGGACAGYLGHPFLKRGYLTE